MLVVEYSLQRQRLVWRRHALDIEHDYVLDEAEYLVPAAISLHDGHQVLHFVDRRPGKPACHLFCIVYCWLGNDLVTKVPEEAMATRLLKPDWRRLLLLVFLFMCIALIIKVFRPLLLLLLEDLPHFLL